MKRIVFVCNALRIGGSQTVLLELVRIARAEGFEVIVASRSGVLVDDVERVGARHLPLAIREGKAVGDDPLPVSVAKTAASAIGLAQLVVALRGDALVQASQPWPVAVAAAAASILGRPLVWHAHGTTAVETPPAWLPLVRRSSAAWVAITPEVEHVLRELQPGPATRLMTIPSPIAVAFPQSERAEPRAGVVGVMSTLTANKLDYVLTCLAAAALVARSGRRIHLRVLGDGPARITVESAAHQAHAEAPTLTVSLHPASTTPWEHLRDAQVVVGMGLVALEAVLRGHRVVCASSDGIGGYLTMQTYERLRRTNFTGRGLLAPDAAVLAEELGSALDMSTGSDVADYVRAVHGETAVSAWVELWRSLR